MTRKTEQKKRTYTKRSEVGKVSLRRHKVELCIRNKGATRSVTRQQSKEKPRSKRERNAKRRPHRAAQGGRTDEGYKSLGWAAWNPPLSVITCPVLTPFPPPRSPLRVLLSRPGDWNAAFTYQAIIQGSISQRASITGDLELPLASHGGPSWITKMPFSKLDPLSTDHPESKSYRLTVSQTWNVVRKPGPLWHLALSSCSQRARSTSWSVKQNSGPGWSSARITGSTRPRLMGRAALPLRASRYAQPRAHLTGHSGWGSWCECEAWGLWTQMGVEPWSDTWEPCDLRWVTSPSSQFPQLQDKRNNPIAEMLEVNWNDTTKSLIVRIRKFW